MDNIKNIAITDKNKNESASFVLVFAVPREHAAQLLNAALAPVGTHRGVPATALGLRSRQTGDPAAGLHRDHVLVTRRVRNPIFFGLVALAHSHLFLC